MGAIMRCLWFVGLLVPISAICSKAAAQDVDPLVENADTAYFDFWVGTWFEEKGESSTRLKVASRSSPRFMRRPSKSGGGSCWTTGRR